MNEKEFKKFLHNEMSMGCSCINTALVSIVDIEKRNLNLQLLIFSVGLKKIFNIVSILENLANKNIEINYDKFSYDTLNFRERLLLFSDTLSLYDDKEIVKNAVSFLKTDKNLIALFAALDRNLTFYDQYKLKLPINYRQLCILIYKLLKSLYLFFTLCYKDEFAKEISIYLQNIILVE